MTRIGRTDPVRTAGGGPGRSNISAELSSLRAQSPSTGPFSRAIVFEFLGDPSRRTSEELEVLSADVQGGSSTVRLAPRNSILAQLTNGPGSSIGSQKIVCYPFFPPHICMPLKPGEQVWIMQETQGSSQIGYWFCRVTESSFIDDINFTHADRRFSLYVDKVISDTSSNAVGDTNGEEIRPFDGLKDAEKSPGPPNFTNGPAEGDDVTPTLSVVTGDRQGATEEKVNVYDMIYTGSFAMQSFLLEPVPRFTKRPGDLVFQGSNNTLICLGQDRGWSPGDRPTTAENSNAYTDIDSTGTPSESLSDFCGTIDIVAGRGRFFSQSPPNPDNTQISDTQPRVILNTRGKLEVDKNPACYTSDSQRSSIEYNRFDRPQEGDPDFLTDASRIYVSMRTSGDLHFGATADKIYPAFEGDIADIADSPFVVIKSDEIRIIARKESERDNINGGIRIIKEGTLNEDAASVYLMPTGVVQISGAKIYIGQPDQGAGPGEKSAEPFIKYSELEKLLTKTYDALDQFCQKLLTHTTPGYGSPSIQIVQGATALQSEIQQRKQEIANLQSTRVFGE